MYLGPASAGEDSDGVVLAGELVAPFFGFMVPPEGEDCGSGGITVLRAAMLMA